jgi:hypothetical protein
MGKIPHTPEEQLACLERWSSSRNKLAACCTPAVSPITEKLVFLLLLDKDAKVNN